MARWTKLEALEAVAQGHEDGRDILDTINALESEKALERAALNKLLTEAVSRESDWWAAWFNVEGQPDWTVALQRLAKNRAAASPVSQHYAKEDPCGTAESAITLTNEAIRPIAKHVSPSEELPLLPDQEWNHLTEESRAKLRKWFSLAAERLQLILDEPVSHQAGEDKHEQS